MKLKLNPSMAIPLSVCLAESLGSGDFVYVVQMMMPSREL